MTLAGTEFDTYLRELEDWEGRCGWMYLDTRGNVTAGVGHMIGSAEGAARVGFIGVDPAADWRAVKAARPGLAAGAYQSLTTCRLPDTVIAALKESDLSGAQAELLVAIPATATWPIPVRIACLDMSFNLGVSRFQREYFGPGCHFGAACRRGDWETAAAQSRRIGIQGSRNDYIAGLIRSAGLLRLSPAA